MGWFGESPEEKKARMDKEIAAARARMDAEDAAKAAAPPPPKPKKPAGNGMNGSYKASGRSLQDIIRNRNKMMSGA